MTVWTDPPMLAVSGTLEQLAVHSNAGGWVFEPKVDGIRVRVGQSRVRTRGGRDIKVPELADTLRFLGRAVVDAELYLPGGTSTDVSRLALASRRTLNGDLALEVFDVLVDGHGEDLRGEPLVYRREVMSTLLEGAPSEVGSTDGSDDGMGLWTSGITDGDYSAHVEGVMAKRLDSRYVSGRSTYWVKFKYARTLTVAVTGWDVGEGRRAGHLGALHVALLDGSEVRPVGRVGSGFNGDSLRRLERMLQVGPFCVEVRHMGLTTGGRLRHPVFVRVRDDVDLSAASWDQLEVSG